MKTLNSRASKLPTKLLILALTSMMTACGAKKEPESNNADAILGMASNLQAVETGFVPESISDTGTAQTSGMTKASEDICAGVDFIQCQPRLIRVYLIYGRAAVGLTRAIVTDLAGKLADVKDGTSGTIHDAETDMSIVYAKRSYLDFDFLVLKSNQPVGRVSANPALYTIQFDLNVLDKDKPDSRGGKIEIQVSYSDHSHWNSKITVSEQACNPSKPDDPENGSIKMTRAGDLWSGQAMFYSGTAATFGVEKTCSLQPSDNTSLVTYTDLVANRLAAKANLYLFKRNETSTAQIQNFGLNNVCENYPDYCQAIASANNTSAAAVDAMLNPLTNSYCVRQGSAVVTFASSCQDISPAVAAAPFLENSQWMSPSDFSRLKVEIPSHF